MVVLGDGLVKLELLFVLAAGLLCSQLAQQVGLEGPQLGLIGVAFLEVGLVETQEDVLALDRVHLLSEEEKPFRINCALKQVEKLLQVSQLAQMVL